MDSATATAALVATVLAVGLAGATAGPGAVGAQDASTPGDDRTHATDGRTITVTGQGAAEAPPDRAVVAVAVVATGDDPAAVRDDLAAGAAALDAALANASVPDDRVNTTEFRIAERERPPHEGPGGPGSDEPAYRGVHAFEVTLDDVDRAGPVADAAAGAGADVRYVTFQLSPDRRDALRDRALTAAMADARRQAETLAAAGDLEVTGVRRVDAADRGYGPVADEAVATDAGGATELRPGDVAVQVDLRVTYDATATSTRNGTVTSTPG